MTGDDRHEQLEVHLLATAGAVRQAYQRQLAPLGLNLTESGLLQFLHVDGPLSPTALAERLHIGKMSAGAAVKGLQERGLVTRHQNPDDRRSWLVALTGAGREAATACVQVDRTMVARLRTGLDRPQQQALRDLLATVRANASGTPEA
jgi:DNA-binding MarR family transcriptional regulator